ncbi:tRNA pseudouridine(38-40) synthase TruA [Actinotalea solisilvae]|uniref:tRNA pseudouridine(38-40) synthase TruA n=1 Tax=Actinotalea solisilvae TaxID=2072922 RepID=UPI0027DBA2CE|nr:tRNA pseudouridine(38-40) synthase TruA [Actinotalea solisilvae]
MTATPTEPAVRVRLDLAYDGTDFAGWATQPGLRTVQGTLEAALGTVLRCPEPRLTVAGRTDAGVHARGQVAHVDLDPAVWAAVRGRMTREPGAALVRRLAGVLPPDVVVHRAGPAPRGFDARFAALHRRYAYRIADDPAAVDPLRRHLVVRHRVPLDADAMRAAAAPLVGRHDFAAFCRPRAGATTIRTLEVLTVERPASGEDAGLVVVGVRADAFCHSMVRSLVGALTAVGEGRRDPGWPAALLDGGRREGVVAPPGGLCLEEVAYPPDEELAERAERTRARRPDADAALGPAARAATGPDRAVGAAPDAGTLEG